MPIVPHDHGLPIFLPLPENHPMTPPLSRRRFTGLSLAATAALYGPRPAKAAGI